MAMRSGIYPGSQLRKFRFGLRRQWRSRNKYLKLRKTEPSNKFHLEKARKCGLFRFIMSDSFESLGVASSDLERFCASVCNDFGAPIDYSTFCPEMPSSALHSPSSGPRVFLWRAVEIRARMILDQCFRYKDPSPYKVCAALTISLLSCAPIPDTIPDDVIEDRKLNEIFRYRHSLAAITSLTYCLRALHRARVGNQDYELALPIELSDHFLLDFVATLRAEANHWESLGQGMCQKSLGHLQSSFGHLALLYEACSYIANPDAQNGDRVKFERPS